LCSDNYTLQNTDWDLQVTNREPCDIETAFATVSNCVQNSGTINGGCCCEVRIYIIGENGVEEIPSDTEPHLRFIETNPIIDYSAGYNYNGGSICFDGDEVNYNNDHEFILEFPTIPGNQTPGGIIDCVTIPPNSIGC